jgi:tetratricopeptide (TPR) repeat protein
MIEWLPLFGLIAAIALLWFLRNRGTRDVFVAFVGFIIALAPVLGFVKMAYARSGTIVADHLQYTANVFLLTLIGAGAAWLWNRAQSVGRTAIAVAAVAAITTMAAYSWNRAGVYHDEETLWTDNLAKNPDAWQAHNRLGQFYFDQGKFAEAAPHFERAAALKPELADNHNQLGLVYARLERFEQGIAEYRLALRLKEKNPATAGGSGVATMRTNLANALTLTANNMSEGSSAADPAAHDEAMRRYTEAIAEYEKALELEPRHPAIHRNLAIVLARLGRNREAVEHLRTVLEIVPNEPVARDLLQELERNAPER